MIQRVFFLHGVYMGVIGNILGLILGISITLILGHTNLIQLPPDVYYIDQLPVRLVWEDILSVLFASGTLILLASLYPAWKASKMDPLEAIRYG